MELLVVVIAVLAVVLLVQRSRQQREERADSELVAAELENARHTAEEDVTRFGEELQRLDAQVQMHLVDEAMRQDWQRALDSYESASRSLAMSQRSDDLRHVTTALEDGRYAVACVLARRDGRPLPVRRPPCFFNPAHGPSTDDVDWAPPGGQERRIPVCAADADRLTQGAEPDVRTVPQGPGRVPYWEAGPAYSPWAMGYFSMYAATGLLPAFLLGGLLSSTWDGSPVDGFDTGAGTEGGGADAGGEGDYGDAGDYGGGGDYGAAGDFGGGGDFGGDFGGF